MTQGNNNTHARCSAGRRSLILALASLPLASASLVWGASKTSPSEQNILAALAALEKTTGGRLGMALLDGNGNLLMQYRADERFPLCSTFKMVLAALILKRSASDAALLAKRIRYNHQALVPNSPITKEHLSDGMRIDELCAATMEYSDNTAANLLLDEIGGPKVLTAYARELGDMDFNLVHDERVGGSTTPGDRDDSTTPAAMAHTLQRLALDDGLAVPQRAQLVTWLRATATGTKRIRAGIPAGWEIGHRTGTGDYGTSNDVAVLFRPNQTPLVLALYFTRKHKNDPLHETVLAQAARIVTAPYS